MDGANVFTLSATLKLDDDQFKHALKNDEKDAERAGSKIAHALGTAAKVAGAALAAAGTAVGALVKNAVEGYAEFEQLEGGVAKLFGTGGKSLEEYAEAAGKTVGAVAEEYGRLLSAQKNVMHNASEAYKNAGMSANEYMETVTGFSASLIAGLEGDTLKAAALADKAVRDMSDNANTFGTDIASIQSAYQGFAKQNYTMLDNLKLGYGGTAAEMARLINESGVLGETVKITAKEVNNVSFDKIIEAINITQKRLGIAETTANEAAGTIEGSVNSMKAAWENLIVSLGKGDDLKGNIKKFADSVKTAAENILPAIMSALEGVGTLIVELAPIIADALPTLVTEVLPSLLDSAISLLQNFTTMISENVDTIVPAAIDMILTLVYALLDNAPLLIQAAIDIVVALALGIAENIDELIPAVIDCIMTICDVLTQPENLKAIIEAAIKLIIGIAIGIVKAIPRILEGLWQVITNLWTLFKDEALTPALEKGREMIEQLKKGIIDKINAARDAIGQIAETIRNKIREAIDSALQWGKDLLNNFIDGIKQKWQALKDTVSNVANSVKSFLGFSEPEKGPLSDFHTYAPDMIDLYASGIRQGRAKIEDALRYALGDPSTSLAGNINVGGGGGAAAGIGVVNINVNGAQYSNPTELAEAIGYELQKLTNRREAVYA